MNNIEKYGCMKFINTAKQHKNIYIFGRGYCGEYLIRGFFANDIRPTAVLDNNNGVVGGNLLEIPIISPIEMRPDTDAYVVVSNQNEYNQTAIRDQLISLGLKENQIAQYHQLQPNDVKQMPSYEANDLIRDISNFQFGC